MIYKLEKNRLGTSLYDRTLKVYDYCLMQNLSLKRDLNSMYLTIRPMFSDGGLSENNSEKSQKEFNSI